MEELGVGVRFPVIRIECIGDEFPGIGWIHQLIEEICDLSRHGRRVDDAAVLSVPLYWPRIQIQGPEVARFSISNAAFEMKRDKFTLDRQDIAQLLSSPGGIAAEFEESTSCPEKTDTVPLVMAANNRVIVGGESAGQQGHASAVGSLAGNASRHLHHEGNHRP